MEIQKPKYLELRPEDLKKVQESRKRREDSTIHIDEEWFFIASFGKHFGWGGVQAILNDEIDLATANTLMAAAVKVDYARLYDKSRASFIGTGAANSKDPSKNFDALTKELKKQMVI